MQSSSETPGHSLQAAGVRSLQVEPSTGQSAQVQGWQGRLTFRQPYSGPGTVLGSLNPQSALRGGGCYHVPQLMMEQPRKC